MPSPRITKLLHAAEAGEALAAEQLLELVYAQLRAMAGRRMRLEGEAFTMQATALVHEAYIRLVNGDGQPPHWDNRRHFFFAAAEAMRRILVEHARKRKAAKRGDGKRPGVLDEDQIGCEDGPVDVLDLNEVLDRLAEQDPEKAELVKLRYFTGLTVEETAEVLGVCRRKVQLDWQFIKAWLFRELGGEEA